jgi:hypothetical protein
MISFVFICIHPSIHPSIQQTFIEYHDMNFKDCGNGEAGDWKTDFVSAAVKKLRVH